MPVHLTDKYVAAVQADKRGNIADTVVPGLRLRLSASGAKSWALYYRVPGTHEERLFTLGRYLPGNGGMSLAEARSAAKDLLALIRHGKDPQAEKIESRREARAQLEAPVVRPATFSDLCDDFVKDQSPDWRPATQAAWTRYISKELKPALGDKEPAAIVPADVRAFVDKIRKGIPGEKPDEWVRRPAPVSAQRAYEVLRRVFAWAVWKERLPFSPCEQAKPFERGKRSARAGRAARRAKAYTNDQLRAIFEAAKGTELELLLDLVARTGARSHEVRAARWDDIDEQRKVWSIPPEAQKMGELTGQPHLVPLTAAALRTLKKVRTANEAAGYKKDNSWLFPAPTAKCEVCARPGHTDKPNKVSAAIKDAAGITDRGLIHRFRDTLKTRLSEHGVDARVSEHILGHVVPGIAGVYDHAEMLPQRREALSWWSKELDRILKPKRPQRAARPRSAA